MRESIGKMGVNGERQRLAPQLVTSSRHEHTAESISRGALAPLLPSRAENILKGTHRECWVVQVSLTMLSSTAWGTVSPWSKRFICKHKEAATWLVPQLSTVPVASSPEADSLSDSSPELSSELSSTELMVPGEASMSEQAAAPDCPVRAPSKAGSLPSLHCVGEGAHRCAPCAPN